MVDLDDVPNDFLSFERDLKRRGIAWVTARDDAQRVRALHAGWVSEYRPIFSGALGQSESIDSVDADVAWLRSRSGVRTSADEMRVALRRIARTIERELLPAYDATRWSMASTAPSPLAELERPLASRLRAVAPELADSYEQACRDLTDPSRSTFVGPAAEFREVLRSTIDSLAPDDDEIRTAEWFKGHQGNPTQAERIRAILGDRDRAKPPSKTLDIIDEAVGAVGRLTYSRASATLHVSRKASVDEVEKLRGWVDAVLSEILPVAAGD